MLRFTVVAIVLAVVSAESDDLNKKCARLGNYDSMLCCKPGLPRPKADIDEFKECFKPPQVPNSCEIAICIAKKRGYASSDSGDIDMEAFEKIVAKDFEDYPDLITAIKNNCINGDIDKFGPPHHEVCRLMKMERCIHKESVKACKEWDDTGSCAGIKELIKECEWKHYILT